MSKNKKWFKVVVTQDIKPYYLCGFEKGHEAFAKADSDGQVKLISRDGRINKITPEEARVALEYVRRNGKYVTAKRTKLLDIGWENKFNDKINGL